jgi:acyl-CoA dehydrogenase
MVDSGALVASGTSEKGVGGDILGSTCTVEPDGAGGLRIDKESPNISYLDLAGGILITAVRHRKGAKPVQVLVAVDRHGLELRPGPQARFMGLHGIVNAPYALTARFREEAIFSEPYPVIARATMTPSVHLFWAAYWSGLARRALDKVRACLNAEKPTNPDVAALTRCEFSRLVDLHYQMNALIRDAIADFEGGAGAAAFAMTYTARVKRLKTRCSELVNDICQGALLLIGMRGYAEEGTYSLSEVIRDALSSKVMISNYRLLIHNAEIERYLEDGL